MRIAVTGASGFVGGQIVRELSLQGHEVLAFGRRTAERLPTRFSCYTSWDVSAGPISAPRVDAVVHCAAMVGDWGAGDLYEAVNVRGTRNVLTSFASADRFVHVSTSSVYSDEVAKTRIAESAPIGDCRYSIYGRTKAAAERIVAHRRPDAIILRPHIVYGPGDTTLLPRVRAARRLGLLTVPGSARNRLSVTHVDNLALAVECALHASHARGPYNVADDGEVTVEELLETVLARAGAPTHLMRIPRGIAWQAAALLESVWRVGDEPRGPPITRYLVAQLADDHTLDTTRARKEIGYMPRWSYRDGPLTRDVT